MERQVGNFAGRIEFEPDKLCGKDTAEIGLHPVNSFAFGKAKLIFMIDASFHEKCIYLREMLYLLNFMSYEQETIDVSVWGSDMPDGCLFR